MLLLQCGQGFGTCTRCPTMGETADDGVDEDGGDDGLIKSNAYCMGVVPRLKRPLGEEPPRLLALCRERRDFVVEIVVRWRRSLGLRRHLDGGEDGRRDGATVITSTQPAKLVAQADG
jgi:hypothetical protein